MSIPKVAGIETEYGISSSPSDGDVGPLAFRLLNTYYKQLSGQSLHYTTNPINAPINKYRVMSDDEQGRTRFHTMLPNGARLYVDHFHPEYCTAECLDPSDVVAHDKAGERILANSVKMLREELGPDQTVNLFKNNIDYKGQSYGCHENYLVEAGTYNNLIYRNPDVTFGCLVPCKHPLK